MRGKKISAAATAALAVIVVSLLMTGSQEGTVYGLTPSMAGLPAC